MSVTSYLSENEAKNLQKSNIQLAQIPDFEMGYLENHLGHWGQWWLILLYFSHSFIWAKLFFDQSFSLTQQPSSKNEDPVKFVKINYNNLSMRLMYVEYHHFYNYWENL